MLPMNKLMEDVAEFTKARESGEVAAAETEEIIKNKVVLFANTLSEKYKEHISVELVVALMTSYQDSVDQKKEDSELKRGTQIIYVPSHAKHVEDHPDCERGFVITDKGETVFCRYFSRLHHEELRTIGSSESTNKRDLVVRDTIEQSHVDKLIETIKTNPEIYGDIK